MTYYRFHWSFVTIAASVLLCALSVLPCHAQTSDPTTINNKIMCGYQGWHRYNGDGANQGWYHWTNDGNAPSMTSTNGTITNNLHTDLWPDTTELAASEKSLLTDWTDINFNQTYAYSDYNPATVNRHFLWMQQYGIDGAWVQRFCSDCPGGSTYSSNYGPMMTVLSNVEAAAANNGRVWAIDYDGTGNSWTSAQLVTLIENDWTNLVNLGVTGKTGYLHCKGEPVVNIWPFFSDSSHVLAPSDAVSLVQWFHTPGKYQAYVVAGTIENPDWTGTQAWLPAIESCDSVQAWNVGNGYKDSNGVLHAAVSNWPNDLATAKAAGLNWIPVVYPGFSWNHMNNYPFTGSSSSTWPRRGGQFLWEQIQELKALGVTQAFVAMFDEVDEGTAVYKCTNTPPCFYNSSSVSGQTPFVTYDGLPTDWFLQEINVAGQLLRSTNPMPTQIPLAPIPSGLYTLTLPFSTPLNFDALGSGTASGTAADINTPTGAANQQWIFSYKGSGLYSIHPSYSTSLALTVKNGGTQNGTLVDLETDQASTSQLWYLSNYNGQYMLVPEIAPGAVLTDPGQSTTTGTQLTIWASVTQTWSITPVAAVAPGSYWMKAGFNNNLCMDGLNSGTGSGTVIDTNTFSSASNQKWNFAYSGPNWIEANNGSDIPGMAQYDIQAGYSTNLAATVSGASAFLNTDQGLTPQRWSIASTPNVFSMGTWWFQLLQFEPLSSPGNVLTDPNSSTLVGAANPIAVTPNTGSSAGLWNETWTPILVSQSFTNGNYRIQSYGSQTSFLDALGGGTQNGTVVDIWSYNNVHQNWIFTYKGNGYYDINPSYDTALSLTDTGASATWGSKIILQQDQGLSSQLWAVCPVANNPGVYTLSPECALCDVLDVFGSNYANGQQPDMWQSCFTPNQQWMVKTYY